MTPGGCGFIIQGGSMNKEMKLNILLEGQKSGVAQTCRKHGLSRTLYYRWLKRYQAQGLEGLADPGRSFVPANRTRPEVEAVVLLLIRKYPRYGPRAVNYLLEESGYRISESAVFNIMKRNQLTQMEQRLKFARKNDAPMKATDYDIHEVLSGECWIAWATELGTFSPMGSVYEFTIFDLKSRIACSRLYDTMSFENFEDLFTAVALPVAQTLKLSIRYLCFFDQRRIFGKPRQHALTRIEDILHDNGLDTKIHFLNPSDDLKEIPALKKEYTRTSLAYILPHISQGNSFSHVKLLFQQWIRDYNINHRMDYEDGRFTPVEYHTEKTHRKIILPLWAYINRDY